MIASNEGLRSYLAFIYFDTGDIFSARVLAARNSPIGKRGATGHEQKLVPELNIFLVSRFNGQATRY